jgi:hypothetical protein
VSECYARIWGGHSSTCAGFQALSMRTRWQNGSLHHINFCKCCDRRGTEFQEYCYQGRAWVLLRNICGISLVAVQRWLAFMTQKRSDGKVSHFNHLVSLRFLQPACCSKRRLLQFDILRQCYCSQFARKPLLSNTTKYAETLDHVSRQLASSQLKAFSRSPPGNWGHPSASYSLQPRRSAR